MDSLGQLRGTSLEKGRRVGSGASFGNFFRYPIAGF